MTKTLTSLYRDLRPLDHSPVAAESAWWLEGLRAAALDDPVRASLCFVSSADLSAELASNRNLEPRVALDLAMNAVSASLRARDPERARRLFEQLQHFWAWQALPESDRGWFTEATEELAGEVNKLLEDFRKAVETLRTALRGVRTLGDLSEALVEELLEAFPGVAGFHWAAHRVAEHRQEIEEAAKRLAVARRLDPEEPKFVTAEMLLLARTEPPDVCRRRCEELFRASRRVSGRAAYGMAIALLQAGHRQFYAEVRQACREASRHGEDLSPRERRIVSLLEEYCDWRLGLPGARRPASGSLESEIGVDLPLPPPEDDEYEGTLLREGLASLEAAA